MLHAQASTSNPRDDLESQHEEHRTPQPVSSHTIVLSDVLPPPLWTYVDCRKLDFLRGQMLHMIMPHPSLDLSEVTLRDVTLQALQETPAWTNEVPLQFDFYTDGSCHRALQKAATGIVLLVHSEQGVRFGGFHTTVCWHDASAPRAEATAVAVALYWALRIVADANFAHARFCFHFDSLFAGRAAQGICHSDLNHDLTCIVRSFALWLEQLVTHPIQWAHSC